MRLVRVARTLDQYIEYGAAVLILLIFMFVLIAHWLACVWYTIGDHEASQGVTYGWLCKLAREIEAEFTVAAPGGGASVAAVTGNATRHGVGGHGGGRVALDGGPTNLMAYTTALYFTLSCITSVGFGNVSPVTEYEKIFCVFMMILGGTS